MSDRADRLRKICVMLILALALGGAFTVAGGGRAAYAPAGPALQTGDQGPAIDPNGGTRNARGWGIDPNGDPREEAAASGDVGGTLDPNGRTRQGAVPAGDAGGAMDPNGGSRQAGDQG